VPALAQSSIRQIHAILSGVQACCALEWPVSNLIDQVHRSWRQST
jgi:hypothetical protein